MNRIGVGLLVIACLAAGARVVWIETHDPLAAAEAMVMELSPSMSCPSVSVSGGVKTQTCLDGRDSLQIQSQGDIKLLNWSRHSRPLDESTRFTEQLHRTFTEKGWTVKQCPESVVPAGRTHSAYVSTTSAAGFSTLIDQGGDTARYFIVLSSPVDTSLKLLCK